MNEKLDLSKLSPEEQQEIARLIAENKQLKEQEQILLSNDKKLKEKLAALEQEELEKVKKIQSQNQTINELTSILIKEKHLIAKYNLERYVSKADLPRRPDEVKAKRQRGLASTVDKE